MRRWIILLLLAPGCSRVEAQPDGSVDVDGATVDVSVDAEVDALPSCSVTGVQPGAPWPLTGGDIGRTGHSAFKGPRTPKLRWSSPYGQYFQNFGSSPAVAADGTVYVTDLSGRLHAFAPDGTEKWARPGFDGYAGPAIGCDGVVYAWGKQTTSIPTPDQSVLVAMAPDGTTLWRRERTTKFSYFDTSPLPAPGGRVVHGADGLYSFELDGGLDWQLGIIGTPRPSARSDGTVVTAVLFSDDAGDAGISATLAVGRDGSILWQDATRVGWGLLSPDGTYYSANQTLGLAAFSPSGQQTWQIDVPVIAPMALGPGDTLYAPTKAGLERVHLSTHTHEIVVPGPFDELYPTIVVDAEGVGFLTYKETVRAIRPDGSILFTFDLGALGDKVAVTAPALADGVLYVAGYEHLYAIGP